MKEKRLKINNMQRREFETKELGLRVMQIKHF